ncbi:hypothetical protein DFH07DRAFT_766391 [Mycena maculata]|uniref:Uncharacterized protein n=1 Tax=Mycena maculata TaxID=230809 RepID=A0AAD7NW72_9AGAR|nr:hypothetical protein DFH07DRAFT_766391 [Mycena maculata]
MQLTTLHKVPDTGCPETCWSIRMILISSPPIYFRLSLKGTLPGFGKKQFLHHTWDMLCSGMDCRLRDPDQESHVLVTAKAQEPDGDTSHQPYDPRSKIDTRVDKEGPDASKASSRQHRQLEARQDSPVWKDDVLLKNLHQKTTEIPAEYGSRALPEKQ